MTTKSKKKCLITSCFGKKCNLDYCPCDCHLKKEKYAKLREEFRNWFWRDAIHVREDFYTHDGRGNWVAVASDVEDFIIKSLDQREKEIVEEIEKFKESKFLVKCDKCGKQTDIWADGFVIEIVNFLTKNDTQT